MVDDLINRALCIFNSQTPPIQVPEYIRRLWNHYTRNTVTLNVTQLMNDYKWISSLFMTINDAKGAEIFLKVANICEIFNNADEIVFVMPKGHILSHEQCTSLVSIVNVDMKLRFKWPLEMPRANRARINEYRFTNWSKCFAPGSISFQCNGANVTQKRIEHNTKSNEIIENTQFDESITPFTTHGKPQTVRVLAAVEAFLLQIANHALAAESIFNLILCFYALPVNIRYKQQIKQFLCCPITDTWHSMHLKTVVCETFGIWINAGVRFTYRGKDVNEWRQHTWQETDIFDVETVVNWQHVANAM
eukprot:778392_1